MSATTYDAVPYGSYPFAQSHPENLFAIADLFGHAAPPVERARVLELGCASGGNLLPMAADLPGSEFVGVDLSGRQIAEARALAERAGLTNVSFREMSILDIDAAMGQFDYVLCHGVYSWVPAAVREHILAVCSARLAPAGVAYVSYNTLPGWNTVRTIRDLMTFHVRDAADPVQQIAEAREALPFVLQALEGSATPYAETLRAELSSLRDAPDHYLFHEYLEEVNHPVYFRDFIADARARGLDYLADTDLPSMFIENLPRATSSKLRTVDDIVATEQYMDFIRNRRFRCTLLVHGGNVRRRALATRDIERFHLSTRAAVMSEAGPSVLRGDAPVHFDVQGTAFSIREPVSKTAMVVLAEQDGRPLAFDALCAATAARVGVGEHEHVRSQLTDGLNLLRQVFAGLVHVHVSPGRYAATVSARPAVSKLAREQAAHDGRATNHRHQSHELGPVTAALMQLADGTRDRDALVAAVTAEFRAGRLGFAPEEGVREASTGDAARVAALCDEALAWLAANAFLERE